MTLNPHGWDLPLTDHMVYEESPYSPLPNAAQSVAERLVMLGHLSFNMKVWGSQTGRGGRYWTAYGEHIEGATSNPDVASWWCSLMQQLPGVPLRNMTLLHEKNLLCHPSRLPIKKVDGEGFEGVDDQEVLNVLRTYALDLRDRTRVWAKTRRDLRNVVQAVDEKDDDA